METKLGFIAHELQEVIPYAVKGEKDGKGDEDKKKTETMRISKVLAQNIIFNTISNFMFHFINFRYSLESSKDVILYFCKRYELDISRTH